MTNKTVRSNPMYSYNQYRILSDEERRELIIYIQEALTKAIELKLELEQLGSDDHLWNLKDWDIAFGMLAWLSPHSAEPVTDPFNNKTHYPEELDPVEHQFKCLNLALRKLDMQGIKYAKKHCEGELNNTDIRKRMDVQRARKAHAKSLEGHKKLNELFQFGKASA